jgi:serine/threonine protein phosphatase PrpC
VKERLQERLIQWFTRRASPFGAMVVEGLGAIATAIGSRPDNQDRAIIARYDAMVPNESFVFYGLCDGIGGMREGAVCACRGLATVLSEMILQPRANPTERLLNAASIANEDIYDIYHEQGGCTFAGILAGYGGSSAATNVGDSRIYSRTDKSIAQVTIDDNIAAQLQLLGKDQPQTNEFSKQLTQYLGVGRALQPVILRDFRLRETGFLISSDGIHSLPPRLLSELVLAEPNTGEVAKRLTSIARWRKGNDNASVICMPSGLEATIRESKWQKSGVLEIWDSFGKLDIFVEALAVERFSDAYAIGKAPIEASLPIDPPVSERDLRGGRRSRKGSPRKHKEKTGIEITEHPAQ